MERYDAEYGVETIKDIRGMRRLSTRYYPEIPDSEGDVFIVSKRGMRWDNLAYQYFNNQRLWFILARANGYANGSLLVPAGVRIRIPNLSTQQIEEILIN